MRPKKARLPVIVLAPLALLLLLVGGMRLIALLTEDHDDTPPSLSEGEAHHPLPPPIPTPPPKPVDAAMQQALEKTVTGQIAAFHRKDFAGALLFSEEAFRNEWSADGFRDMIQGRYGALVSAEKNTFGQAQWNGVIANLPVTVQDHNGTKDRFVFLLRAADTEKAWHVVGCQPVPGGAPQEKPVTAAAAQNFEPRLDQQASDTVP